MNKMMKLNTKISAKLVDVRGDVCEYADMIGCSGTLYLSAEMTTIGLILVEMKHLGFIASEQFKKII